MCRERKEVLILIAIFEPSGIFGTLLVLPTSSNFYNFSEHSSNHYDFQSIHVRPVVHSIVRHFTLPPRILQELEGDFNSTPNFWNFREHSAGR